MLDAAGAKFLASNQGPTFLVPLDVQKLVHLGRRLQVEDAVVLNEDTRGSCATPLESGRWDVLILAGGIPSKAEKRLLDGRRREERELEPMFDPVLLLTDGASRFAARNLNCGGEGVAFGARARPLLDMRKKFCTIILFSCAVIFL